MNDALTLPLAIIGIAIAVLTFTVEKMDQVLHRSSRAGQPLQMLFRRHVPLVCLFVCFCFCVITASSGIELIFRITRFFGESQGSLDLALERDITRQFTFRAHRLISIIAFASYALFGYVASLFLSTLLDWLLDCPTLLRLLLRLRFVARLVLEPTVLDRLWQLRAWTKAIRVEEDPATVLGVCREALDFALRDGKGTAECRALQVNLSVRTSMTREDASLWTERVVHALRAQADQELLISAVDRKLHGSR